MAGFLTLRHFPELDLPSASEQESSDQVFSSLIATDFSLLATQKGPRIAEPLKLIVPAVAVTEASHSPAAGVSQNR